jgi:thiol-disulfide isomerase/thioredoxin
VRLPRTFFAAFALCLIAATVALAAPPQRGTLGPPRPQGSGSGTQVLGASVGVAPPALSVAHLTGPDPANLNELAGRVVLLEFYATWCTSCQGLSGFLDAIHRDKHADGLTVLAVSSESESTIRAQLSRDPVEYTVARDLGQTAARYNVSAFPTVVLVGRDGKVRHTMVGAGGQPMVDLIVSLQRELAQPAP